MELYCLQEYSVKHVNNWNLIYKGVKISSLLVKYNLKKIKVVFETKEIFP